MSVVIVRNGNFNGPLLAEELEASFPAIIEDAGTERRALYSLAFDRGELRIYLDVHVNLDALDAVLNAHDPRGKSKAQKRAGKKQEVEASIRQKLLGLGFTPEELGFLFEFLQKESESSRIG